MPSSWIDVIVPTSSVVFSTELPSSPSVSLYIASSMMTSPSTTIKPTQSTLQPSELWSDFQSVAMATAELTSMATELPWTNDFTATSPPLESTSFSTGFTTEPTDQTTPVDSVDGDNFTTLSPLNVTSEMPIVSTEVAVFSAKDTTVTQTDSPPVETTHLQLNTSDAYVNFWVKSGQYIWMLLIVPFTAEVNK